MDDYLGWIFLMMFFFGGPILAATGSGVKKLLEHRETMARIKKQHKQGD